MPSIVGLGFGPGGSPAGVVLLGFSPGADVESPDTLEIEEGVVALLLADAGVLGPTAGRVWADEAPADVEPPYLVVTLVSQVAEWESADRDGDHADEADGADEVTLDVAAVAEGRAACKALARLADAALLDAEPTTRTFFLRRSGRTTFLEPEKGRRGSDLWRTVITYRALADLH